MSTTAPDATTDVTTFRGRSLEELLPQIREQLGPDAVVLRQRDGLIGGIGGFFQQRFVEIDARAGAHRVDVYDEEPDAPAESFAQLLADAEVAADPVVTAAAAPVPAGTTDADRAGGAEDARAPGEDPGCAPGWAGPDQTGPARHGAGPTPAGPTPAGPTPAETLAVELQRAGMSASFVARLIADAEAHELPFANGDLREATRRAVARRLPTSLPHRAGGLAVAFAGPGSTACATALAAAYKQAGRDARAVASLDKGRTLLQRGNLDAVIALDLPPIATVRTEVAALATRVAALQLDELLAVTPADLDLPTARALLDRLEPLAPTALALSLDRQPSSIGAAVELACVSRLPIAYVQIDDSIGPADPARLAERLLP